MQIDLTGTSVLVTGASRGIGRALAQGLAEAGATVVLHYRRERAAAEALAETLDAPTHVLQADLAEVDACNRLFDETLAAVGSLDVLVNNAGVAVSLPLDGPDDAWLDGWTRTINVNLRAAELLSRRFVRHLRARREDDPEAVGRIINVASRAAFRGDTTEYAAYAASKGGLVALTRTLARGLGKEGLRAFTLAPGFIRTDMAQDFVDAYGADYIVDDLALDELTEPHHLAPLVTLLASGLSDHATGCTIDVNAGSYVH